jgi:hypothetical protein
MPAGLLIEAAAWRLRRVGDPLLYRSARRVPTYAVPVLWASLTEMGVLILNTSTSRHSDASGYFVYPDRPSMAVCGVPIVYVPSSGR